MSDYYLVLVPNVGEVEHPLELSKKGLEWLINNEVIKSKKTDCVLGQEGGHAPANGIKKAFRDEIPDYNFDSFLKLAVNGLEIITQRTVFHAESLDSIICPTCKADIIESDWSKSVDDWHFNKADSITCFNCNTTQSLHKYQFKSEAGEWKFSNLGFKFWNFPNEKFDSSFVTSFEGVLGLKLSQIPCRL